MPEEGTLSSSLETRGGPLLPSLSPSFYLLSFGSASSICLFHPESVLAPAAVTYQPTDRSQPCAWPHPISTLPVIGAAFTSFVPVPRNIGIMTLRVAATMKSQTEGGSMLRWPDLGSTPPSGQGQLQVSEADVEATGTVTGKSGYTQPNSALHLLLLESAGRRGLRI